MKTRFELGIDVETKGKREIIRRLKRLISTIDVGDGGEYREDRAYSQVHITTEKTEDELDYWLWKNNLNYV